MGLYKGQNIITGSYMLPRADDSRQINISRKRRHKKKEKKKRKRSMKEERSREYEKYLSKKYKFTPFFDSGAYDKECIA
jgi:hypothetical protein